MKNLAATALIFGAAFIFAAPVLLLSNTETAFAQTNNTPPRDDPPPDDPNGDQPTDQGNPCQPGIVALTDCDDRRQETRRRPRPDGRGCFIEQVYALCPLPESEEEQLVIGEAGTLVEWQFGRNQIHEVALEHRYRDPVVIIGPVSDAGADPAFVRVISVAGDRFTMKIEEWPDNDGIHALEEIGYLVVERGDWRLANGVFLRAGTMDGVDHGWAKLPAVQNAADDPLPPVLLTQILSADNPEPLAARQVAGDAQGYEVTLQRDRAGSRTVAPGERIGWVLWEQGSGDQLGSAFLAGQTGVEVTQARTKLIVNELGYAPTVLAAMQTANDTDTAILRYRIGYAQIDVAIEEAGSEAAARDHAAERVGYVLIDPGFIVVFAKDQPGGVSSR